VRVGSAYAIKPLIKYLQRADRADQSLLDNARNDDKCCIATRTVDIQQATNHVRALPT